MNKTKTNIAVKDNTGIRRKINIVSGDSGSFNSGDMLDANGVEMLVENKINSLVNGASASLDTLKEIENAIESLGASIPTKVSDLENDSAFITEQDVNTNTVSIISNQPFPSDWPTSSSDSFSDLINAIDSDDDAIKGKVYLSTVHYTDLPDNLADAELKVEIMNSTGNHKIAVFTLTSANKSPYNWHTTMWYGNLDTWHSYALVENGAGE